MVRVGVQVWRAACVQRRVVMRAQVRGAAARVAVWRAVAVAVRVGCAQAAAAVRVRRWQAAQCAACARRGGVARQRGSVCHARRQRGENWSIVHGAGSPRPRHPPPSLPRMGTG